MVSAPAAADAVARAKAMALPVGLHLVLVEGRPTLPPADIPDLVDAGGMFRGDMVRASFAMFLRPKVRRLREGLEFFQFLRTREDMIVS